MNLCAPPLLAAVLFSAAERVAAAPADPPPAADAPQVAASEAFAPGNPQAQFREAVRLSEAGDTERARDLLQKMIERYPEIPEPYNNLAVLEAAQGNLERARELLTAAVRIAPYHAAAQENLGDVLIRLAQRHYQAAQRHGQKDIADKIRRTEKFFQPEE